MTPEFEQAIFLVCAIAFPIFVLAWGHHSHISKPILIGLLVLGAYIFLSGWINAPPTQQGGAVGAPSSPVDDEIKPLTE